MHAWIDGSCVVVIRVSGLSSPYVTESHDADLTNAMNKLFEDNEKVSIVKCM